MFTDIALCITGPVAGMLATSAGYTAPFLFGGAASLLGLAIVFVLQRRASPSSRSISL
jgi:predicted MFS family arabinose efflux permease